MPNTLKSLVEVTPTYEFLRDRYKSAGLSPDLFVRDDGGRPVIMKRSGSISQVRRSSTAVLQAISQASVPKTDAWKAAKDWAKSGFDLTTLDQSLLRTLVEERGMPWSPELYERTVPYFASDERVDSMGDIVRQSWIFDRFEKNSPLPYSHRWEDPPVGRAVFWDVVKRKSADYSGPALALLGVFGKEGDYGFGDSIFRLIKSRLLVSGSVGFYPSKVIDVRDESERRELGLGEYGLIFEDNHLIEFSPCTIPANPGAVIASAAELVTSAAHSRAIGPEDLFVLRSLWRDQSVIKDDADSFLMVEAALVAIGRTLWPKAQWELHDLDEPFDFSTIDWSAVNRAFGEEEEEEDEPESKPEPEPEADPEAEPESEADDEMEDGPEADPEAEPESDEQEADDSDEEAEPESDDEEEPEADGPSPLVMLQETHQLMQGVAASMDEIKSTLAAIRESMMDVPERSGSQPEDKLLNELSAKIERFMNHTGE